MIVEYVRYRIAEDRRPAFLADCLDEAGLLGDPEFRAAFVGYVEWGTRLAVANSRPGAEVVREAPVPHWGWAVAPPWPGINLNVQNWSGSSTS